MSLYLEQQASGIWKIRGSVQGVAYSKSARTRVRKEAEAIKAQLESDAFKRAVFGVKAVATFAEAAADYMTAGGPNDHMEPLIERLGMRLLSDIRQAVIDEAATEMKPDAAPATRIRQVYTPISAVMNFAAEQGMCELIKIRKPKVEAGRVDYLTPATAEDFLAALASHTANLIIFLLSTGCRITEALDLEWDDVSPEGERVVFWRTKGGYARGVNLGPRARAALPPRGTGAVWRNDEGEPWHAYDAVNLALNRASEKAELRHAHNHLMRHTWATWAYACTRDMTYLMKQGGWKSAGMVMKYAHAASDDLARAVLAKGWSFDGQELPGFLKNSDISDTSAKQP